MLKLVIGTLGRTDMNEARRFAKGRKPVKNIWSQRRRPVLVQRKDVTPEAWDYVPVWKKYPKRLLDQVNKGPCMTLTLRASASQQTFVGPPKPARKHKGYPLTNWKRKRLNAAKSMKYILQMQLGAKLQTVGGNSLI